MTTREKVHTAQAPQAIGPYSQAIIANGFVYTAGQVALDPATGQLAGDNVADQTAQVFKNIRAVLQAAGSDLQYIVKTTVFLRTMDDFAAMNGVYATYFEGIDPPARSTVGGLQLPKNALVEIETVALIP